MEVKFKPIIPTIAKFSTFDIGYVAEQALQEFGGVLQDEFEKTTSTWKKPLKFTIRYDRGAVSVRVFTNDDIYRYVNEGVEPHPIVAVNAKALRYRSGYTAKTMPGRIASGEGGKSGGTKFAKSVWHPGIKARNFDDVIYNKMIQQRTFQTIFGRILAEYNAKRK